MAELQTQDYLLLREQASKVGGWGGGMVWLVLLPWLSWVPAMCQVWSKVLKGAIR